MILPLICAVMVWSDGDSGTCSTANGERVRFRLHGVDAAEVAPYTRCRRQPTIRACDPRFREVGQLGAQRARMLAADGATCSVVNRDRYQRIVVNCTANGQDIASVLVREGLAWADTDYSRAYVGDEAAARREGRGVWAR